MTNKEAVNWIINIMADIGKAEHRDLWHYEQALMEIREMLESQPEQPEIIRCKDCKFYTPMNRETKTGICNLTMHQNFGDDWFCAGAERREE